MGRLLSAAEYDLERRVRQLEEDLDIAAAKLQRAEHENGTLARENGQLRSKLDAANSAIEFVESDQL